MASLVCAIDDPIVLDKFERVSRQIDDFHLIVVGGDPREIGARLAGATAEAFCFAPISVDRMLRLRHAVCASQGPGPSMRGAVTIAGPDPAFVHYVLGYGIDDVLDTALPDAEFAAAVSSFVHGTKMACAPLLLPEVDVLHSVMHGAIDYADETDRRLVQLISVGYADREIGLILGFSHQALRNRISHLMLRSGIRNRTQLAARYTFESINRGIAGQP